jgi:hypothetical protein
VAIRANPTCLEGLDLALKWVGRGSDPDIARCTSAVARGCEQRCDCGFSGECLKRLRAIDDLLAERACLEICH